MSDRPWKTKPDGELMYISKGRFRDQSGDLWINKGVCLGCEEGVLLILYSPLTEGELKNSPFANIKSHRLCTECNVKIDTIINNKYKEWIKI